MAIETVTAEPPSTSPKKGVQELLQAVSYVLSVSDLAEQHADDSLDEGGFSSPAYRMQSLCSQAVQQIAAVIEELDRKEVQHG